MNAITDPNRIKKDDLGNPDICMVSYYHNLFTNSEEKKIVCEECRAGKRGCVACKKQLAKNIIDYLAPIREKRKYYEEHPELIDKILKEGTEKARMVAKETMKDVKKVYIFECDGEWAEALEKTFSPYTEKIEIIKKYVGGEDKEENITLDRFFENLPLDCIKADIEGSCKYF